MSNYENPISDLEYDLLTVVQSKAESVRAYQKYMDDARQRNSQGLCPVVPAPAQ